MLACYSACQSAGVLEYWSTCTRTRTSTRTGTGTGTGIYTYTAPVPIPVLVLVLASCRRGEALAYPSMMYPKPQTSPRTRTAGDRRTTCPLSRLGGHAEAVVDLLGSCAPASGSVHVLLLLLLPVIGSLPTLAVASAA